MSKKKVFHIIQSLGNGGCENMLLRTLPLIGTFEHTLITLKEPGELAPHFVSAGISVKTIHCKNFFDLPAIFFLRTFIRKERPDIVITYLFHADMIGRVFLRQTISAPIIPFLRTTYNHPRYRIARMLERITAPLVKRYFANSEAVKDFYTNRIGVSLEKITVIQNGIDIARFDSIKPDPELKKSLAIHPGDFVVTCVANLAENKGHRFLLEAFESLFQTKKNIKLLIVGDGIERKNLERQAEEYQSGKSIIFLGTRSDIPALLTVSDLFVLPTLFEGQSNALLEAMAARLPVITTDIPENRVIIRNNENGILVPPGSTTALANALDKIVHHSEASRRLAQEARRTVEEHFSVSKSAKAFESAISSHL